MCTHSRSHRTTQHALISARPLAGLRAFGSIAAFVGSYLVFCLLPAAASSAALAWFFIRESGRPIGNQQANLRSALKPCRGQSLGAYHTPTAASFLGDPGRCRRAH